MMAAAFTSAATYGNQSVCMSQLGVRGGDCTGRVRHHTSPSAAAARPQECRLWLESVGKRRSRKHCESRSGRDTFREGSSRISINAFAVAVAVHPRAIISLCRRLAGDEGPDCWCEWRR